MDTKGGERMIAIAVDDERPMLNALVNAVHSSKDISEVNEFSSCTEALEWINEHPVDLAFLDISMRGMGGLTLAERILEKQPECKIVFCTGYSEYAVEAFRIHVSGYLMKPISAEDVQREIDHIKKEKAAEKKLTIRCFGEFEVFANGEILNFKRPKTKELLAYLVDRNGAGVTSNQICTILWENQEDDKKNRNYLYQLINDLKTTLESVDASDVLLKNNGTYAVDIKKIDCDYARYLMVGRPEFHGEYMRQYSWAESTFARLLEVERKRV